MNYGLQLAASGALTSLYRMDVLSNNLANMGTVGFKPDMPGVLQRDTARVENGLGMASSNALLERLGGGVLSAPNRIRFDQGVPTPSGNPLDAAINGEGFFVVKDENAPAADSLRLTRDGRFTRDPQGRVVSATTGLPLLDISNRPIVLRSDAPIDIAPSGLIKQGGEPVARIQLSQPPDLSRLSKAGSCMFRMPAGATLRPGSGSIQQHAIESSAVDPVTELMAITDASKAAEGNFALIQGHDRLLDRAINSLGRVS